MRSSNNPSPAPRAALREVGKSILGLPGAIYDGFVETGHALGEGAAVAFNDDLGDKLNAIYSTEVDGAQGTLLGLRAVTAVAGATGAAKAVTQTAKVGEKLADGLKDRIEAGEIKKAAAKKIAERKEGLNFEKDSFEVENSPELITAEGQANASSYYPLKEQLAAENLANISAADSRLAAAVR